MRVPHMGWNEIVPREDALLVKSLGPKPYLYFAHSYYCPVVEATAATCEYGVPYTAVLEDDNVFGVQFHPEKSGPLGLRIVKNFVDL
jgi:imidazole glycerol phosphate synthase glutamine amidotransferase subunit